METIALEEKRLEELIEKTVRKHLKVDLQDMDEIRRSPAASIIRIESRLDSIETRMTRDMVTRGEFHEALGQSRVELKGEMATNRSELKGEMAAMRVEVKGEMAAMRVELKDEIWKVKLYIILLAALIVLTNPTVLELFGKLLGILK